MINVFSDVAHLPLQVKNVLLEGLINFCLKYLSFRHIIINAERKNESKRTKLYKPNKVSSCHIRHTNKFKFHELLRCAYFMLLGPV